MEFSGSGTAEVSAGRKDAEEQLNVAAAAAGKKVSGWEPKGGRS